MPLDSPFQPLQKFPSGIALAWNAITATTYTASPQDSVLQTNNSAGTAVTLPLSTSVPAGFRLTVVNAGSAGTTTVTPSEGPPDDTINGSDASFTTGLTTQWGSVVFISDGISNWIAVAGA